VRLSVVVPAYREAGRIGETVATLRSELAPVHHEGGVEIVVVDDGSDDGTAAAGRAAGADVVVEFPVNRGKGAAVRAGMRIASGSVVAFTDADLSYPPHQILGLLEEVEQGADAAVGDRRHPDSVAVTDASWLRRTGSRAVAGRVAPAAPRSRRPPCTPPVRRTMGVTAIAQGSSVTSIWLPTRTSPSETMRRVA